MPIYAYKCDSCGHRQDALQKISDPPLAVCPACGQAAYVKQLTAAGFQLTGSGWYVTDFRGGNSAAGADKAADDKPPAPADAADAKTTAAPAAADKSATEAGAAKAASAAAPAPAPAPVTRKSDASATGPK
jgi:putative FmdB family regulatory protein